MAVHLTPEPGTPCGYSLTHGMNGIPAEVFVDMGVVGTVACCKECADLYARLTGQQ
jgi:hypothetical protein